MKELFDNDSVLKSHDQVTKRITLSEEDNNQYVIVGGLPNNAFTVKLDIEKRNYKVKSRYLRKGAKFIHKGCDYVLFIPDRSLALIIEFKSNNAKGVLDQYKSSEIFLEYVQSLYNFREIVSINYTFKYVLFSTNAKHQVFLTEEKPMESLKTDRKGDLQTIYCYGMPERIHLNKLL